MIENYKLELKFLDESDSFCHGVETGILYTKLQYELLQDTPEIIHTDNIEQIKLIAKEFSYEVIIDNSEIECWSYATFVKTSKPKFYVVK